MTGQTNDSLIQEWTECRASVGRLDTILEDLRKVGFSLITGLLTASSFLGLASASGQGRGGAFLAIIMLIDCLYSVDTYYQVLLSAAVERALDLEAISDPPLRLTKTVTQKAVATKVGVVTLGLYVGLVLVAMTLGAAAAGPLTQLGELIIFGGACSVWVHACLLAIRKGSDRLHSTPQGRELRSSQAR